MLLIRFYQTLLSFWFGGNCRFTPSCSQFCIECFETLSYTQALKLSTRRLLNCHPWGSFAYDPVATKNEYKGMFK